MRQHEFSVAWPAEVVETRGCIVGLDVLEAHPGTSLRGYRHVSLLQPCSNSTRTAHLAHLFKNACPWRLSRVSWNLSGGPPPDTAHGVGVGRPPRHHQEGDHRDQHVPEEHAEDECRARARRTG